MEGILLQNYNICIITHTIRNLVGKYRFCDMIKRKFHFILGEMDHLPEVAFYMQGGIDDVVTKAEELAKQNV